MNNEITETALPDWNRARFLLSRIKTAIRLSLAGQVLLGQELQIIKSALGFAGRGGDRRSNTSDQSLKSARRTWPEWCKAELGISDQTANIFIECHEAAKQRVLKNGGDVALIGLMEKNPADRTEAEEEALATMVDKLVWGDTQKSLLEELRLVKRHVPLAGGDTSDHRKPALPEPRQMAFAFFGGVPEVLGKLRKGLTSLVLSPDYQAYLHELPLIGEADEGLGLEDLKATLEDVLHGEVARLLADVKQAIADRHQSLSYANPNR